MDISVIASAIASQDPFSATYTLSGEQLPLLFGRVQQEDLRQYDLVAFKEIGSPLFHDVIVWDNSMKARIVLCQKMREMTKTAAPTRKRLCVTDDKGVVVIGSKTFEFDSVRYKGRVIDLGVILGKRPWRWTLGRKYSPCVAKADGSKISQCSPQRSNFVVYVPAEVLTVGTVFETERREYKEPKITKTRYRVETVGLNYVETAILEQAQIDPPHRRTVFAPLPEHIELPEEDRWFA